MVHIEDEGSEFEAPIDIVWKYMQAGEPHARAHATIRNREAKPIGEGVMVATMERNWRGKWVRVVNRLTFLPPLGGVQEFLEGPLAGSKMMTVYTPKGSPTGADVYGEFVSTEIPANQLETAVREWLTVSYEEDAPALRAFSGES